MERTVEKDISCDDDGLIMIRTTANHPFDMIENFLCLFDVEVNACASGGSAEKFHSVVARRSSLSTRATGFTASAGFFLAAKSRPDLSAARSDVDVGDAAVATRSREEAFAFAHIRCEYARRQTVDRGIVCFDRIAKLVVPQHVKNRCECSLSTTSVCEGISTIAGRT